MKVYISGKIGEESPRPETLAKFQAAEEMLKRKGFEVFVPTKSGLGRSAELMSHVHIRLRERVKGYCDLIAELDYSKTRDWYSCIMLLDLGELSWCDAIYMLPDWKQSPGAMVEYYYAIATKKKLFFSEEKDAIMHLWSEWSLENQESLSLSISTKLAEEYANKHVNEIWIPMEQYRY